jgi:hypothetical protein
MINLTKQAKGGRTHMLHLLSLLAWRPGTARLAWQTVAALTSTLALAIFSLTTHNLWPLILGTLGVLFCCTPNRNVHLTMWSVLALAAGATLAFPTQQPYALGMLGFFALAALSQNETMRRLATSSLWSACLIACSPLWLGSLTTLPPLLPTSLTLCPLLAASLPPIVIALSSPRPGALKHLCVSVMLGVCLLVWDAHLAFLALFVGYTLLLLPRRLFTLALCGVLLSLLAVLWSMPWAVKHAHLWLGHGASTEKWITLMKRMLHWKELLLWIDKHPWCGWGMGSAPKLSNRLVFVPLRFPHNMFLQLWIEGGILSALLLSLNLLGFGWRAIAAHAQALSAAAPGMLAVGVTALIQGAFHQNLWSPWLWFPTGLAWLFVLWRTPLAHPRVSVTPPHCNRPEHHNERPHVA